jgi:hypothetical protein
VGRHLVCFLIELFSNGGHPIPTPEIHGGRESESIEPVLRFLKDIVPKEAQTAQKSLARFDEALFVMGLEERMKTGRRVALRGSDPDLSAVAEEWRKIAKQYQSMLPDDEDPER